MLINSMAKQIYAIIIKCCVKYIIAALLTARNLLLTPNVVAVTEN